MVVTSFSRVTIARARVNTPTIDQTASEVQLHRVLYVLKFLRAMLLRLPAQGHLAAGSDPRGPGAGHPESASRPGGWSGRFLDIHRGPLRRCPEFPDMDLPFDHKCPAFRAEDSSNVACARGDFDGFHSVAGIEICVSKP